MTDYELAKELNKIYINGQVQNETARLIIHYLNKGMSQTAFLEYQYDGDKIPKYFKWGKEFDLLLHKELGCRTHGIKGCTKNFCGRKLNND